MYLDYDWIDFVDVRVTGGARDEVTGASGSTTVFDESSVRFETNGGLLTIAEIAPRELPAGELLGHPLRMGFRRRVRELHEPGGRTLGLLLDDVSGAMIAAGYVHAMGGLLDPGTRPVQETRTPDASAAQLAQADLCSGWRSDGTMMVSIRAGEPMPFLPVPPVPEHPEGSDWPAVEIPEPGLRRLRRIDVTPVGDEWEIDAWFRDTYCDPTGATGSLHEYTVEARVDANRQTLLEVRATPHALPWHECPAAADAVGKLVGQPIAELRSSVPQTLQGLESCTHLTNELRELADVPAMVARL
jgi:Protein of unknown function (DUF2889)